MFKDVNEAMNVLGNKQKRYCYDNPTLSAYTIMFSSFAKVGRYFFFETTIPHGMALNYWAVGSFGEVSELGILACGFFVSILTRLLSLASMRARRLWLLRSKFRR